ncbi:metallophosphoesterase [Peribacillus asahii]|uniref:Phosphoesterase n=1 Tax=Peribacillus asahii TaxID=228899 RepID=A0A398B8S9_9BACI|nr:metallophosphoesterase [Peribacillus asahii]RID86385.1 metallophosphoesterase [Peribacillus asahii]
MKVLVMSDSHGLTDEISIIAERHKHEVVSMIHCGDSELMKEDPLMMEWTAVRGNCDRDMTYPNDIVEEIADQKFLITHGHLYNVKMTLLSISYRSEETDAKIICFGHSHAAGSELIDGRLYVNPGSIRQPRGRKEKTYAILDIINQQVNVTFYDITGKVVEELNNTYQIS